MVLAFGYRPSPTIDVARRGISESLENDKELVNAQGIRWQSAQFRNQQ